VWKTEVKLMQKNTLAVVGHIGPVARGEPMSIPHALAALAALGQPSRLEIFRLLMRHEPDGLPAGTIAETVGCPHNSLSTHVSILARSGLVQGTRDGRSIVYRANVEGMQALIAFLVNDCCDGHPELCSLREALRETGCCPPEPKSTRRKNNRVPRHQHKPG
jgi:ArsR family transcriptional regulator